MQEVNAELKWNYIAKETGLTIDQQKKESKQDKIWEDLGRNLQETGEEGKNEG
jgi:hypothetical protein